MLIIIVHQIKLKMHEEQQVPEEYICPLSLKVMKDPVMIETGHTFQREEIQKWFKTQNTNPKTNLPIKSKNLIPNISLRNAILSYEENLNQSRRGITNDEIKSRIQDQFTRFTKAEEKLTKNYQSWFEKCEKKLENCQQIVSFPEGKYKGELKDEKPHGDGIMNYFKDDIVYGGQWENGIPRGYGKKTINELCYYGEWKNNCLQGMGWIKNKQKNAIVFRGQFYKNKRNGFGIQYITQYRIYFGEWRNNKKHGKGKEKDNYSSSVYHGIWMKGEKDGIGLKVEGQKSFEEYWVKGKKCKDQKQYWIIRRSVQQKFPANKSEKCCRIF